MENEWLGLFGNILEIFFLRGDESVTKIGFKLFESSRGLRTAVQNIRNGRRARSNESAKVSGGGARDLSETTRKKKGAQKGQVHGEARATEVEREMEREP